MFMSVLLYTICCFYIIFFCFFTLIPLTEAKVQPLASNSLDMERYCNILSFE